MKRATFFLGLLATLAAASLSSCCGRGCLVQNAPPAGAAQTASAETVKQPGS